MKEKFRSFDFKPAKVEKIERAEKIIQEYQKQGYKLTVRQIYYQFVGRGWLENSQREYKNLGTALRMAVLLVNSIGMSSRIEFG
jgi:hypothetical protein